MRRALKLLPTLIFLAVLMPLVNVSYTEAAKLLGQRPVPVPVVGTGSMYPSLFWENTEGGPDDPAKKVIDEYRTTPRMFHAFPGFTLAGRQFFAPQFRFGDFVAFQSSTTQDLLQSEGKDPTFGFIKRLIGLPGDQIELRDGYVYRNGELILEPYLAKPRSTFGDSFLPDCQPLTIPPDHYLVLGDNRKASADSRGALGLIQSSDITFYLPLTAQALYRPLWRDPSSDASLAGTPTLDPALFLKQVNQVRQEAHLPLLTLKTTLNQAAKLKARALLQSQPLTMEKALAQAGYSNILTSEFYIRGRYTATELLENLLSFPDTRTQILDSRYTDLGLISLNQEVNGCPTEVLVGYLGGYLPATYSEATLSSWRQLRDSLQAVLPSWEQARDNADLDQAKLRELLALYQTRLTLAEEIIQVMERQEWLSDAQQARIQADPTNAERATQLAKELNQKP